MRRVVIVLLVIIVAIALVVGLHPSPTRTSDDFETPTDGFVARLPRWLSDPALALRNALSLQRFRHEVERRSSVAA